MLLGRMALAGLCVAVAGIGACTSVRRIQPVEYLAENSPEVIWVTDASNTVVPVADAEIRRDTLRGMRRGTREPVAIPLNQVRNVRARTPDKTKNAILVTGVIVGFVSSVYALFISKTGSVTDGVECGFDEDGRPISYC